MTTTQGYLQKKEDVTLTNIGRELLLAWRRAHGTDTGTAHTMVGPDGLVVVIEEAFTKAELLMAEQQRGGEILTRYVRSLLAHVCQEQASQVETAVNKRVACTAVSLDPAAGWVICVFKLAQ